MKHFFGFSYSTVICFFRVFLMTSMFVLMCKADETVHINIFKFDKQNKEAVFNKRFKIIVTDQDTIDVTQETPETTPRFNRGKGEIRRHILKEIYRDPSTNQCGEVSGYGLLGFPEWGEQYEQFIHFHYYQYSRTGETPGDVYKLLPRTNTNLCKKNFPAAHSPDDFVRVFIDATRNFSELSNQTPLSTIQAFFEPVKERWATVFLDAGLGINCNWRIEYLLSETAPGEFKFLGFWLLAPQTAGDGDAAGDGSVYFVQADLEEEPLEIIPPQVPSEEPMGGATSDVDPSSAGTNVLSPPAKQDGDYNVYASVKLSTHTASRGKYSSLTTHMILPDPDRYSKGPKNLTPEQKDFQRKQYRTQREAIEILKITGRITDDSSEDDIIQALQESASYLESTIRGNRKFDRDRDPDTGAGGGYGSAGVTSVFARVTLNN